MQLTHWHNPVFNCWVNMLAAVLDHRCCIYSCGSEILEAVQRATLGLFDISVVSQIWVWFSKFNVGGAILEFRFFEPQPFAAHASHASEPNL